MLDKFREFSFEIKVAKTGRPIPVVDGVHLHSIYNPEKEATAFFDKYKDQLTQNRNLLILGLGLNYHCEKFYQYLSEHFSDKKIYIIEPNMKVFEHCFNNNILIDDNSISYLVEKEIHELYEDVEFCNFLITKPTVVAHPPSFNLYQQYFKSFLSFKADDSIKSVLKHIKDNQIKSLLENISHDASGLNLQELLSPDGPLLSKEKLNKDDFLLLAFNNLEKGKQEVING